MGWRRNGRAQPGGAGSRSAASRRRRRRARPAGGPCPPCAHRPAGVATPSPPLQPTPGRWRYTEGATPRARAPAPAAPRREGAAAPWGVGCPPHSPSHQPATPRASSSRRRCCTSCSSTPAAASAGSPWAPPLGGDGGSSAAAAAVRRARCVSGAVGGRGSGTGGSGTGGSGRLAHALNQTHPERAGRAGTPACHTTAPLAPHLLTPRLVAAQQPRQLPHGAALPHAERQQLRLGHARRAARGDVGDARVAAKRPRAACVAQRGQG
jgi:hypothetical protein